MFIHRLIWETYLQTKGAPLTWRHTSTSWATARREWLLWQISWPLRKTDWTGCTRSTSNRQCVAFRWLAKLFRRVWGRQRNDGHFLSQAQQQPRLDQKRQLDCLNNRSSSRKLICPNCLHNIGLIGQAQQSLSPPPTLWVQKEKMSYRGKRPGGGLETDIEKAREEGLWY